MTRFNERSSSYDNNDDKEKLLNIQKLENINNIKNPIPTQHKVRPKTNKRTKSVLEKTTISNQNKNLIINN